VCACVCVCVCVCVRTRVCVSGVVKDQTQTSQLVIIHLFQSRAAPKSDECGKMERVKKEG